MSSVSASRALGIVARWRVAAKGAAAARPMSAAAAAAPQMKPASAAEEPAVNAAPASETAAPAPRRLSELSNGQLVHLLKAGLLSSHRLEADLGDAVRAVAVRRAFVAESVLRDSHGTIDPRAALSSGLPMAEFDYRNFYNSILNTNCEAVIGYVPLPVGVVGPLVLDGKPFYVPLATTEGALVASTNRGCAAIRRAGGASTALLGEGMTRAPLIRMPSLAEAAALKAWVEVPENFAAVAAAFNSTSRFGRLKSLRATVAGRNVYLRFKAVTGDAMGMNMITKGVNEGLALLGRTFPGLRVLSLSGNLCTDKKPSAINWIDGRGKSVVAEVRLSGHVLKHVLKTSAQAMAELNLGKNLVGSAMAGSVGGFNAHASNIVTAAFLATGQDGAQNVESSTCLTLMEVDESIVDPVADPHGKDGPGLLMTVTMPSVEVGTVGGGTSLPAQAAALEILGLRGSDAATPGAHAAQLARVIAGVTLAGELSLMSALTTNDLLKSHMKLNRKPAAVEGGHGGHNAVGHVTERMRAKLSELAALASSSGINHHSAHPAEASHHYASAAATAPAAAAAGSHAAGSSGGHGGAHKTVHFAAPVAGGAPAGSHPHPLHMGGAGVGAASAAASAAGGVFTGAAHAPGRRYFAAGRGFVHAHSLHQGHAHHGHTLGLHWAAQQALGGAGGGGALAGKGGKPIAAPGVCEESRNGHHGAYEDHALPVP